VASFIGSPPMNLLPCHVDGNRVTIDDAGANADVAPEDPVPAAARTLGIRPEYITIHATEAPNSLPAKIYVTQMLGSESLIVVRIGPHIVSVRIFGDDTPEFDEQVWLTFDPNRLFFYDEAGDMLA
jgi:ABC-type sugar transport system ATPase subunit